MTQPPDLLQGGCSGFLCCHVGGIIVGGIIVEGRQKDDLLRDRTALARRDEASPALQRPRRQREVASGLRIQVGDAEEG